ncbi:MAG: FeoA domain-containing protein [Melioribacteraceae bacterium]
MLSINPITALTIFFLILGLLVIFFWPQKGIYTRYKRGIINTKRALIEDALKHIYDYEYRNLIPTLNSIAGNLNITTDSSTDLIAELKNHSLINFNNQKISLTTEGRSYALRVIRIHRLWENYLAEETGYTELDWHDEAELVEHKMSREEADKLAAKMGNPKYDPHGDPIPTSEGALPSKKGKHLNDIQVGEIVRVTHIEDEPKAIYAQLLAQGFYPGKEIQVIDANSEKIKIAMDGEERIVTPLLATGVTVQTISKPEFINEKLKNLLDLKSGEEAEVLKISPMVRGQQRRRLLDFGILPGAKISILMKSPLQDPIGYLVKDTIVALRKKQAELIFVKGNS